MVERYSQRNNDFKYRLHVVVDNSEADQSVASLLGSGAACLGG